MGLTNEDFEEARHALLMLQAKAQSNAAYTLASVLSAWLYELETQRFMLVRGKFGDEPIGLRKSRINGHGAE